MAYIHRFKRKKHTCTFSRKYSFFHIKNISEQELGKWDVLNLSLENMILSGLRNQTLKASNITVNINDITELHQILIGANSRLILSKFLRYYYYLSDNCYVQTWKTKLGRFAQIINFGIKYGPIFNK